MAGRFREHALVDRRQRVGQHAGQLTGLNAVADVGVAEAVEKVEQVAVAGLVEQAEDVAPDPPPVLGSRRSDRVVTECLLQSVDRQALARDIELEVDADPARGRKNQLSARRVAVEALSPAPRVWNVSLPSAWRHRSSSQT